ncbi:MAG: extracellular solute-binding protein, partial [Clostridia bacterium]|nr:extracellular solute-binding protein [Clostridia bacterium]
VISDALYNRQRMVEEKFNSTIESTVNDAGLTTITNNVKGGTDICDAMFYYADKTMATALSGILFDWTDNGVTDFTAPWWDQRIQNDYSIGSHIFLMDGEINIRDDLRTMVLIYNKTLYDSYGYNGTYGTPYKKVSEGEWSLDVLLEMIKDKTEDPKNDKGMWGLLSENSGPYTFFLGTGLKSVSNDQGEITSHVGDQTVYEALEKCLSLAANTDVMIANNGNHFVGGSVWDDVSDVFMEGHALFRSTTLSAVNRLLEMKDDYGILPIPNGGNSKEYYCYASGTNTTPVAIPRNVAEPEKALTMLEALAFYSMTSDSGNYNSLHDAFYTLMGDARLARTYEDTEMLNIIFSSKTYDIDQCSSITGFESSYFNLAKAGNVNSLNATVKAATKMANTKVSSFMKSIAEQYGD